MEVQNPPKPQLPMPSRTAAFTLVELLIAMAIVAVLTALAMGGMSSIRRQANSVKCIANLRLIGVANINYMQENSGKIAAMGGDNQANDPYDFWFCVLHPFLGGEIDRLNFLPVFICPSDGIKGMKLTGATREIDRRSYGANAYLKNKKSSQIPTHSRVAYAGDMAWYYLNTNYIDNSNIANLDKVPRDWHDTRVNIVFLDSHVESFAISTIYPAGENSWIFKGN